MAAEEKIKLILEAQDKMSHKLEKVRGSIKKTTDSSAFMKKAFVSAFGAMSLAMVTRFAMQAVKKFAQFDKAMRNVNSIAQVSEKQFIKMRKAVLDLSVEVPQTATILAAGLYDIQSAGFAGADALALLEVAAIGATAGVTDTKTASNALVTVLNAYALPATEASDVMDILFKTVEKGVVTFPQLAHSIGKVVATANVAKVPFDEVAAAIATMTKGGISADIATTSLNKALLSIIAPQEQAAKFAASLGIEFGSQALEAKGLSGILAEVMAKTGGNVDALKALFPELRAFKAVTSLARKEGEAFAEDLANIATKNGRAGAATNAFNEQAKSLDFQLQLLNSTGERLTIILVENFTPALTDAIQAIIKAVEWMEKIKSAGEKFERQNKGLSKVLEKIDKILIELKNQFIKLFTPVGHITKLFKMLGGAIDRYAKDTEESAEITGEQQEAFEKEAEAARFAAAAIKAAANEKIIIAKVLSEEQIKAAEKAAEKKEKALLRFNDAHQKAILTQTNYELLKLDEQCEEYKLYVEDKKALDEWYIAKKNEIEENITDKEKEEAEKREKKWEENFQRIGESFRDNIVDKMIDGTFEIGDAFNELGRAILKAMLTETLVPLGEAAASFGKQLRDTLFSGGGGGGDGGDGVGAATGKAAVGAVTSGGGLGAVSGAIGAALPAVAVGAAVGVAAKFLDDYFNPKSMSIADSAKWAGVTPGEYQAFLDKTLNPSSDAYEKIKGKIDDLSKNFMGFAEGGVVTKPTLGLIGEAGPEAVIPLSKMEQMGGVNVTFQTLLVDDMTTKKAARIIDEEINNLRSIDQSQIFANNA